MNAAAIAIAIRATQPREIPAIAPLFRDFLDELDELITKRQNTINKTVKFMNTNERDDGRIKDKNRGLTFQLMQW